MSPAIPRRAVYSLRTAEPWMTSSCDRVLPSCSICLAAATIDCRIWSRRSRNGESAPWKKSCRSLLWKSIYEKKWPLAATANEPWVMQFFYFFGGGGVDKVQFTFSKQHLGSSGHYAWKLTRKKMLGVPRLEPVSAGRDGSKLPLSYAAPHESHGTNYQALLRGLNRLQKSCSLYGKPTHGHFHLGPHF